VAFYKKKQARRGGDPRKFAESIRISPAEGMSLILFTANPDEVAQSLPLVGPRDDNLVSLELSSLIFC